ncbi:ABC transporter permease [Aquabacterium lacunae]|uniref:ABC transporter permease n=1 Tax=Aquabacterium lacunae TaxID=2528630 RepID=A0A4Q9GVT1_9BURK|nr:ABC transporter permease [Aquabacterium lacunae]TBO27962.1 ABC transporter permease [Aquabacterium lacunae]
MTAVSRHAQPVWPLVWQLLRQVSWPEVRLHPGRHATALLAVLLGVALAFSVHLINASALSEFSAAVRSVNGQADLSLKAARGGLPEALYAQVAQAPGVQRASPVIDVRTQALGRDGQRHGLRVMGLDPMVAAPLMPQHMPESADAEARLQMFAPDSVYLNARARTLLGMAPGDALQVQQGMAWRTLRVRGGVSAGGEALAVMDIGSAQHLLGTLGRIDRIDLQLAAGPSPTDWVRQQALPAGVVAEQADDSRQRVSNVSRAYRVNLTVLALVALFTGGFLVFSILALAVARRQPTLALMGVLGLSARERRLLVLAEAAVLGALGSLLGLALGTGLAAAALRLMGGDLGGGYFAGVSPSLQFSPVAAGVYGALGVLAALLGAWVPARTAEALAPAQALKGLGSVSAEGPRAWWGPLAMAAGVGLSLLPPVADMPLAAYLGVAALLLGGIVSVPPLVGAVLQRWPEPRQATALMALERARRMRHTATVTLAGVVASLSLSVALTVMVASFRGSVIDWLDQVLPADLYARTTTADSSDAQHFGPEFMAQVAKVPGVTQAVGLRVSSVQLPSDSGGSQPAVALLARPLPDPARSLPLVGPLQAARPGKISVYVSEPMQALHGASPGRTLSLPLVAGQPPVQAVVRGVWRDYARQQGAVLIDLADYQRLTGDRQLNDLALWLAPGVRTADVQQAVRQAATDTGLAGELLSFAEPREIREITLRIFDRSFAVTYWLQAVAIGIGLFGTAASFSAQVLARRKEFGLLTHLGFTRRQVLGTVALEGLALSSVGALLGLALGAAVSVVLVKVVNPQSFHWTMEMQWPVWRLLALAAAVVVAGTLTAWWAGRHAASHQAVQAVKEDW